MKNIFYSSLFLLLAVSSCVNDRNFADTQTVLETNSSFAAMNSNAILIGELHNEGLNNIYENVISGLTDESLAEVNTMISNSSWNYSVSTYPDIGNYEEIMLNIHNDSYAGNFDTSEFSPELMTEINALISYVNSTITSSNMNAGEEIFDYSRALLDTPPTALEDYELEAWKNAVDVMGYSAIYWFQNIESWEVHLGGVSVDKCNWLCRLWTNIKPIVVADLVGAATGFVSGFLKAPATWASAAAGALVGAASGSAGAAVKEITN